MSERFPFDYPFINHPSTIMLLKSPPKRMELVTIETFKKGKDESENFRFYPSLACSFEFKHKDKQNALEVDVALPIAEL